MPLRKAPKPRRKRATATKTQASELVIITGLSGSGKASVLKAFEDLGYYCVDNLPMDLMPQFAELATNSAEIIRTAIVVDVREGQRLDRLPALLRSLKHQLHTIVLFLEASDEALLRRFSETRRPHPLGTDAPVKASIAAEQGILVSCVSFGFRHGVPDEADLVFDVRFLPNPHFVPEFRPFTGRHPQVAKYIRSFPQTQEFIARISDLLVYLLPHYVKEGKSYLTIAFGCTGGQHRSVLIAEEVAKRLRKSRYHVKVVHRDCPR